MFNKLYIILSQTRRLIFDYLILGEKKCRFQPTCSEYCHQAIKKYKFKGIWLCLKRIAKCNPYNKGGYDPVK